jgi:predicted lipoprotein with Yx(FWY)xxD motif
MRVPLAALLGAALLTGCGAQGEPVAGAHPTSVFDGGGSGAPNADLSLPAAVKGRPGGAGVYLVDPRGYTLYTYAQDSTPGKSVCNGECAKAWPPLLAPVNAADVGAFTRIVRDDASLQWAWAGQPLYTYSKDREPGQALGDRVGNAWNVAFEPIVLPPGIAIRSLYLGRILTDAGGHTLYVRDDEPAGRPGRSRCAAACLEEWTPLAAPLLANAIGDWSLLARADGTRQWAYRGRRLYLNVRDLKAGDTAGDGEEKLWHPALLDAAPPPPSWVTVQSSDMGEIFADEHGLTLYTLAGSLDKIRATLCDAACVHTYWRPVPAAPGARPSGDWTLVAAEDGGAGLLWAYKGSPVYTHTRDTGPGEISGDKWAAGVGGTGGGWMPLLRRRDLEE